MSSVCWSVVMRSMASFLPLAGIEGSDGEVTVVQQLVFDAQSRLSPQLRQFWAYSTEKVQTNDGWGLTLHRFHPHRPTNKPPIVLLPGHGTTAWTFFGGKSGGIAPALASWGRDVWALDPRGSGDSQHVSGASRTDVRISDKVGIDLPAALTHIQNRTGWTELDAVGHSLGGVMLYLHLLTRPITSIRRAVTISSPLALPETLVPRFVAGKLGSMVTRQISRVPMTRFMQMIGSFMRINWMGVHFDPNHVCDESFSGFLESGIADVFGSELEELLRWVRASDFRAILPNVCNRKRFKTPIRFMVGAADRLTPPEQVFEVYRRVAGEERDFQVLGRTSGLAHDYRHTDVLIGADVHNDVVPLVAEWLQ